ncbi:proteolipid protein 2-like isoform X1 [Carcharodon carcharias]|uniref:proteolipid protein 2-like isoform X1 n=1 Tax=Carcharodon carcharias TaxID=13397 RepID=UPI001B7DE3F7|nr:proteolipid protein 2-like isoform X1 [Carcharodon carcharias]
MDLAAVPAASHAGWSRFTSYAKTLQGGLILLEMLLCLSVAACCLWSYYIGYVACPLIEVIFAGIFYWVYMNGYDREASALNWSWTDIFRCVSAAVILLVISLINLSRRHVGNVLGGMTHLPIRPEQDYELHGGTWEWEGGHSAPRASPAFQSDHGSCGSCLGSVNP